MLVLRNTPSTAPMWWSTTARPRKPSTRDPGIFRYAVVMRPSGLDDSTHRPSSTAAAEAPGAGISVGCAPATPTLARWWLGPGRRQKQEEDGWVSTSLPPIDRLDCHGFTIHKNRSAIIYNESCSLRTVVFPREEDHAGQRGERQHRKGPREAEKRGVNTHPNAEPSQFDPYLGRPMRLFGTLEKGEYVIRDPSPHHRVMMIGLAGGPNNNNNNNSKHTSARRPCRSDDPCRLPVVVNPIDAALLLLC
jgi:hypothetical protein